MLKHKDKLWKKLNGNCNYSRVHDHKKLDCFKFKKESGDNPVKGPKKWGKKDGEKKGFNVKKIKCYHCHEVRHLAKDCPLNKKDQTDAFFVGCVDSMSNNSTKLDDKGFEVVTYKVVINDYSYEREIVDQCKTQH